MAPGGKEQGQEEDDHPETEQGKTKRKGKVTEQWWTEAGGWGGQLSSLPVEKHWAKWAPTPEPKA